MAWKRGSGQSVSRLTGAAAPTCAVLLAACGASEETRGRGDELASEVDAAETDTLGQTSPQSDGTTHVPPDPDAGDGTTTAGGAESEPAEDGLCNSAGWCAVVSAPIADQISAISGSKDGAVVFAVGPSGAIYERNSDRWRMHEDVTSANLGLVQVLSPADVWVAGNQGIWHYDGAKWTQNLDQLTTSLVTTRSGELWAIVSRSELLHFDGETWALAALHEESSFLALGEESGVLDCMAGSEPNELWVLVYSSQSRNYFGLRVFHYDGSQFTLLDGEYDQGLPSLVTVGQDVYMADGSGWYDLRKSFERSEPLGNFVVHTPQAEFVVVNDGVKRLDDGEYVTREWPVAVWGSSASELWVARPEGGLVRVDGTQRAPERSYTEIDLPGPWLTISGIEWSASAQDAWRGPDLEHFDGKSWSKPNLVNPPYVLQMDGSGPDDVWFVGFRSTKLWHWNGTEVEEVSTPASDVWPTRVRAFAPSQTWVSVPDGGFIDLYFFDGRDWSLEKRFEYDPLSFSGDYLVALAGPSRTNAYVALQDELLHFDGATWTRLFTPNNDTLRAVAVDTDSLWLLGDEFVYERNGAEFESQRYGFQPRGWIGLTDDAVWVGGWGPAGSGGGGILRRPR